MLVCLILCPWYAAGSTALALGAVVTVGWLALRRFRGGDTLLSREAWALTSAVLQLLAAGIAVVRGCARSAAQPAQVLTDLRYLPFLWLCAIAVHRESDRRIVYTGIAIIALVWSLDGLVQAVTGYSIGGPPTADRISGVFRAKHPHLGQVLASLAAFPLGMAARRIGAIGWLGVALLVGAVVLLAGARAAWITYALALLCSGWRLLGWKRMLGVFAAGAIGLVVLAVVFPRNLHDRIVLTEAVFSGDQPDLTGADRAPADMGGSRVHDPRASDQWRGRARVPRCICGLRAAASREACWGEGDALHAHQIVLEILSETGAIGLLLWLIGAAIAIRAWRFATHRRECATMPAIALAVTVFPLNTHLAFYSSFWGGFTLLLVGLSLARCWR